MTAILLTIAVVVVDVCEVVHPDFVTLSTVSPYSLIFRGSENYQPVDDKSLLVITKFTVLLACRMSYYFPDMCRDFFTS